jgi:hypothetical protein
MLEENIFIANRENFTVSNEKVKIKVRKMTDFYAITILIHDVRIATLEIPDFGKQKEIENNPPSLDEKDK